jgi:hypothetical protein
MQQISHQSMILLVLSPISNPYCLQLLHHFTPFTGLHCFSSSSPSYSVMLIAADATASSAFATFTITVTTSAA